MRRLLFLVLILALVAGTATAAEWRLGLQGGANNSGLSGDVPSGVSFGRRSAPAAGALVEWRLTGDVWLSLQPMFVGRGTTSQITITGEDKTVAGPTVELDYLAVPVLARIVSGNGHTYVVGGLNPAYLLDARLVDGTTTEDASASLNSFAIAADIGFGVLVPAGRSLLSFEVRYEQSILNLSASGQEEGENSLPVRFRSSGFQFLAGFLWPLGGE